MVNHMTNHSPIQHVVNIVMTNLPTHSQVLTPQPRVIVQHPVLTIPPSAVTLPQLMAMVVH